VKKRSQLKTTFGASGWTKRSKATDEFSAKNSAACFSRSLPI